jgi:hypothetical protein
MVLFLVGRVDVAPLFKEEHVWVIPIHLDRREARLWVSPRSNGVDDAIRDAAVEHSLLP